VAAASHGVNGVPSLSSFLTGSNNRRLFSKRPRSPLHIHFNSADYYSMHTSFKSPVVWEPFPKGRPALSYSLLASHRDDLKCGTDWI
jgi:hypothetical protein